uniref:ATP-binding cassette sub-family G member 4-like protein n=1 Tax=Sogatella furcifera TaxID=113103 RepID=A0A481P0M4_SOGFU|nr:ATP-binding cassette sub-family G member 4-like protein [Sogatella furcifera]
MSGIFKLFNLKTGSVQKESSHNIYTVDLTQDGTDQQSAFSLKHLPKRQPVDIKFIDLNYSVPDNSRSGSKKILNDLQGEFRSGELVGILGPSGAGKSTLLNALVGFGTKGRSGTILVNNQVMDAESFRKVSCYIMQKGELLPYLTVGEAMMVSANLKLGTSVSKSEKKVIIDEILTAIGLDKHIDTYCKNLSGGQKKRLLVAVELVYNPPLMFLDEPTSGLDSSSSVQCVSLLKSLAQGGRTIVCTIHQPNARTFELFDQLFVLAPGHCIYQGPVHSLVPFLATHSLICPSYHNPADFVIEVAMGQHGPIQALTKEVNRNIKEKFKEQENRICDKINEIDQPNNRNSISGEKFRILSSELELSPRDENSFNSQKNEGEFDVCERPSSLFQFYVLLRRTLTSTLRDIHLTHLRFVSHSVIGLLIGYLYLNKGQDASNIINNAGCVFFTVMFLMFSSMMPTILTFPLEMDVYKREHLNNWYSLGPLYMAKSLVDIPFQMVYTIVYISIVYYLTDQPQEIERFSMFLFVSILMSLVASGIGLLTGTALAIETGTYFGPVSCVPCILFSGFFLSLDSIPKSLRWLGNIFYLRYAFEGSMLSIYGYDRPKLDCSEVYCHFRVPSQFLKHLGMQDASYWFDCSVLFFFIVLLRLVTYFVLKYKIKNFTP